MRGFDSRLPHMDKESIIRENFEAILIFMITIAIIGASAIVAILGLQEGRANNIKQRLRTEQITSMCEGTENPATCFVVANSP